MTATITPSDLGLPAKFHTWRPGQWASIETALATDKRFIAASTPTGGGKSLFAIASAILEGKRAVYLTSTKGLQSQLSSDFSECGLVDMRGRQNYQCVRGNTCADGRILECRDAGCPYNASRNEFTDAKLASTNYAYYLSSVMHSEGVGDCGMLILDECFPAGTIIDGTPIEKIQNGDAVLAFDDSTGRFHHKPVTHTFRRKAPHKLLRLTLSDGTVLTCTENHPLWTAEEGWCAAGEVIEHQYLLVYEKKISVQNSEGLPRTGGNELCRVRQRDDINEGLAEVSPTETGPNILQSEVFHDYKEQGITSHTRSTGNAQTTDVIPKSHVQCEDQKQNGVHVEKDRMETIRTRGERERPIGSPETLSGSSQLGNRSVCVFIEDARIPDQLQGGCGESGYVGGRGSGRSESQEHTSTEIGHEERRDASWARVESIEVYEQRDIERFRKVCPDGFVYNLEVEDLHTYTANGVVVHNCHAAVQELCNAIEIRLDHNKSNHIYNTLGSRPPHGEKIAAWRTWAKFLLPKAQKYLKDMKQAGPNKWLALTDQFVLTVSRISAVSEDWILDESNDIETLISPLWPTDYAQSILFRDIPRIILASATLVPKTLSLLGIEEKDSVFLSQDHTFSPDRCPLYLFGACRVDYKMSSGQWQETVGRMDTIIGKRLDRKGIIHTTSYAYQDRILKESEHAGIMIAPKSARETQAAIEEFRDSPAPSILVSPAVTTGFDFSYSECEYQILLKVPFIDARSPVMKARSESDKEYLPYLVAQTLVQTCGRAMRAPDDRCENFLMDQHANWFLNKPEKGGYRHLVPGWFTRQIHWNPPGQPQPPPPLSAGR